MLKASLLVQLRAAMASALDDDDMAASSAGRSNQLQPSSSSLADQQSSAQASTATAEAPVKAGQPSETLAAATQQQPYQATDTRGAIARGGDHGAVPVKLEQDGSSAGLQVGGSATSAALEVPHGTDNEQKRSMIEPGFSGRNHAADLAGTLYETVLLAILEGLRSVLSDGGNSCDASPTCWRLFSCSDLH